MLENPDSLGFWNPHWFKSSLPTDGRNECVTNVPQSQHLDLVNPYKRQMYLLVCGSLISRLFKNREIEDPRIMKNPREI